MSTAILDQDSHLTKDAMTEILRLASTVSCECPRYLVNLLEHVREFREYERQCLVTQPEDMATHEWLESAANNLDLMLSTTISQLARMEGMIDEDNKIVKKATPIP